MKNTIRLTVFLDDGRKISGVYGYLEAHARADFAKTIKGYLSHSINQEEK